MRKIAGSIVAAALVATGFITVGTGAKAATAHSLSISDASVTEGGVATFTVALSPATQAGEVIRVTATTNPGTATGADYTDKTETVTFASSGSTSRTFTVQTTTDAVAEQPEQFRVNLSGATATCPFQPGCGTSVSISDSEGIGTITDGTPVPPPPPPGPSASLAINDLANATTRTDCAFTVTLSQVLASSASVNFDTAGATNQLGGAVSGQLTFAAGETSKALTLDVIKQKRRAGVVTVTLSGATGASIGDGSGTCTIKKKRRRG